METLRLTQNIYSTCEALKMLRIIKCKPNLILNLEDLTVLKRSHDPFNNVKIGQDQPRLKVKHILFYGGLQPFWSSDLKQSNEYSIKQLSDF